MKLDRKGPIGCLYPITAANARNLCRKKLLICACAYTLNYRITEYDIERVIFEQQFAPIAGYLRHVLGTRY